MFAPPPPPLDETQTVLGDCTHEVTNVQSTVDVLVYSYSLMLCTIIM